jgi:hypothetical protein
LRCAQDKESGENDAWLRHVAAALLGSSIGIRRPFLEALSKCLGGSADAGLVGACLTTAGWLSRSLASSVDVDEDGAMDTSLAAFSALVPRLKQCLAPGRPPRHRVLAAMSLHNFSRIPGNARARAGLPLFSVTSASRSCLPEAIAVVVVDCGPSFI